MKKWNTRHPENQLRVLGTNQLGGCFPQIPQAVRQKLKKELNTIRYVRKDFIMTFSKFHNFLPQGKPSFMLTNDMIMKLVTQVKRLKELSKLYKKAIINYPYRPFLLPLPTTYGFWVQHEGVYQEIMLNLIFNENH